MAQQSGMKNNKLVAAQKGLQVVLPWIAAVAVLALCVPLLLYSEIVTTVVLIARQMNKMPEPGAGLVAYIAGAKWIFLLASFALAAFVGLRSRWAAHVYWFWAASSLFRVSAVVTLLLKLTNRIAIAKIAGLWLVTFVVMGVLVHWAAGRAARGQARVGDSKAR